MKRWQRSQNVAARTLRVAKITECHAGRIGVAIIGVNGAVASTVNAGVELMKRGLVPRLGMVTEKTDARISESITEILDLAPLESLVFAGWDLQHANVYEGPSCTKVLPVHLLRKVKGELRAESDPWPAVFARKYVEKLDGKNVIGACRSRRRSRFYEGGLEGFKKPTTSTRRR